MTSSPTVSDTSYDGMTVIVGAGLAGLTTALDLNRPCLLVTATDLGADCASDWAQGGLAAAVGPEDHPELHSQDTLRAGVGLCNPQAVRRIVSAGPAVVDHLLALGARLDQDTNGALRLGLEGAHRRHRIVHADGDGSGREMTRAVAQAVRATPTIHVMPHTRATRLHVDGNGHLSGIDLHHLDTDRHRHVATTHVVLATGGVGALFAHTTNPRGSWGSGLALALRAGAVARDLEMIQFHPTALDVGLDPMPLVSEAVRGEGAHLLDDTGARVLPDDLAPRDVVSRAVWARLTHGHRVFLDTPGSLGSSFAQHFPSITAACHAAGLDPTVDPLPVRPAAHYHMGGLIVDARCRTTVPGLWAVGEVASTGLHGANRLASNSLLEAVVTGRAAAADLRAHRRTSRRASRIPLAPHEVPLRHSDGPSPAIRTLMDHHCGVLRDDTHLRTAVEHLRDDADTDDAALVALLIAWSAKQRTESRGGHTRLDHPETSLPRHHDLTLVSALADIDNPATTRTRPSRSA
ncbi:L-aspartate oxidase [Austwickia sp. TVS 96-490-7B]|uniref:L-aspartate oxidase n=1 Tax=Austwickia sp. TVS 96-490-7B TaxID=2830843 RepID=UPI001C59D159|nr:L-aspartate oxidase [Austwickia sp. TVS 96-490-7B]MBW3086189.1 L-aspartate oxidase [Austwickia sp. TVS 96-490-7B]